jgi:hypothetical protein
MFVHDTVPPGVPEMKSASQYSLFFRGDSQRRPCRNLLHNKDALAAIHKFLRFQIEEHKTGGPLDLP